MTKFSIFKKLSFASSLDYPTCILISTPHIAVKPIDCIFRTMLFSVREKITDNLHVEWEEYMMCMGWSISFKTIACQEAKINIMYTRPHTRCNLIWYEDKDKFIVDRQRNTKQINLSEHERDVPKENK
jgi:hypothetical protein